MAANNVKEEQKTPQRKKKDRGPNLNICAS